MRLLKGSSLCYFAVFMAAFVFFTACGRLHKGSGEKFEKEMRSLSELIDSKKLRELKEEVEELKKRHEESNINLHIVEQAATNLRQRVERMKEKFDSLAARISTSHPDKIEGANIIFLKKEINQLEKDLKRFQERTN